MFAPWLDDERILMLVTGCLGDGMYSHIWRPQAIWDLSKSNVWRTNAISETTIHCRSKIFVTKNLFSTTSWNNNGLILLRKLPGYNKETKTRKCTYLYSTLLIVARFSVLWPIYMYRLQCDFSGTRLEDSQSVYQWGAEVSEGGHESIDPRRKGLMVGEGTKES